MAQKKPKRTGFTVRERSQIAQAVENKKKAAKRSGRPLTAPQIRASRKSMEATILRQRKR